MMTKTEAQKSDGGPTSYYDFAPGWVTFNDFMEHKALNQWHGFSLHLKDIGKALCRFGTKAGTTQAYDVRKIIYSGLRLLMMIEGRDAAFNEMQKLMADPQFKPTTKTPEEEMVNAELRTAIDKCIADGSYAVDHGKASQPWDDPLFQSRAYSVPRSRDEQVVLRVDRRSEPADMG